MECPGPAVWADVALAYCPLPDTSVAIRAKSAVIPARLAARRGPSACYQMAVASRMGREQMVRSLALQRPDQTDLATAVAAFVVVRAAALLFVVAASSARGPMDRGARKDCDKTFFFLSMDPDASPVRLWNVRFMRT